MFGISFKSNLTDLNFTNRDIIGFRFEVLIGKLLDRHGWKYRSNPLKNITEWKQYQRKGVDFDLVDFDIELESKSGYAKVFKSWILRDWITRFSYHNEVRVVIVKPTLKLSSKVFDLLFSYNINLIYPDSISYLIGKGNKVLEPIRNKMKEANKLIEAIDNKTEKVESFKLKNTKPSSTFRDKLSSLNHIFVLSGGTSMEFPRGFYNRLRTSCLNLLSWIKMLVLNLLHDRCGNVALAKRSKTWRPRSGFQISPNQIQSRLIKHTYPCKYKLQIICTKNRKIKYLCKASYRIDWNRLWFYNNMWYCKCHDIPEREGCIQDNAFCFYNMNRDLIDVCPWSKSKMLEHSMFLDSLRKRMKNEMILEKINKNKTMVKHDD